VKRECVNIYFVPTKDYFLYSFTGLRNGAWLVPNTHSSWLINISSSTKREEHFDGRVDVCKSSNNREWTWMEREEEILAQKTKDNFRLSANFIVPNTHTNPFSLFEH
jgi:hypothetical protein